MSAILVVMSPGILLKPANHVFSFKMWQKNLDFVLCRGSVKEKIFEPWIDSLKSKGCEFRQGRGVTDFFFNEETGCISEVLCGNDRIKADAVILALGITSLQEIIKRRSALFSGSDLSTLIF